MAKILIISDAHTPPLYGVRARFFADYLKRKGHTVLFVSEHYPDDNRQTEKPIYPHKRVRIYSLNPVLRFLKRLLIWLADIVFPCKERMFTRGVRRILEERKFDVVICSAFHSFPLLTARTIARELDAKLIVDVRDMAEQTGGYVYHQYHPRWLAPLLKCKQSVEIRRRNEVLRQADAITTVSPWHVEQLRKYNDNVNLIYNGYDADAVLPRAEKQKRFEIVYLGKYYGEPLQSVDNFYSVMSRLVSAEGLDINIVFYTDEESRTRLSEYMPPLLAEHIRFEGYVPRKCVPKILSEASASLVITNKERMEGPHGIMTTKFFEALGAGTPVLCTRSDGSYLAELIIKTRAGVTDDDNDEFADYIRQLYAQWKQTGTTSAGSDPQWQKLLSRQSQAQELERIIEKIC